MFDPYLFWCTKSSRKTGTIRDLLLNTFCKLKHKNILRLTQKESRKFSFLHFLFKIMQVFTQNSDRTGGITCFVYSLCCSLVLDFVCRHCIWTLKEETVSYQVTTLCSARLACIFHHWSMHLERNGKLQLPSGLNYF